MNGNLLREKGKKPSTYIAFTAITQQNPSTNFSHQKIQISFL